MESWSYTWYRRSKDCWRQFWWMKHAPKDIRVKDTEGAAMLEGQRIHKDLENHLKYGTPLPEDLVSMQGYCDWLTQAPGDLFVEDPIVFTEGYEGVTDWRDFDNAWLRVKIDVMKLNPDRTAAFIGDWKSGKRSVDEDQLMLYAVAVFNDPRLTTVDTVSATYLWTKTGEKDIITFARDRKEGLRMKFDDFCNEWADRIQANDFPPNPGKWKCRFCAAKDVCEFKHKEA